MGGTELLRKRSIARPPECTEKTTSVILRLQLLLQAFSFGVSLFSSFCILALSEKIRKKIRVFEICGILRAEKQKKGGKNMPSVEEKVEEYFKKILDDIAAAHS